MSGPMSDVFYVELVYSTTIEVQKDTRFCANCLKRNSRWDFLAWMQATNALLWVKFMSCLLKTFLVKTWVEAVLAFLRTGVFQVVQRHGQLFLGHRKIDKSDSNEESQVKFSNRPQLLNNCWKNKQWFNTLNQTKWRSTWWSVSDFWCLKFSLAEAWSPFLTFCSPPPAEVTTS